MIVENFKIIECTQEELFDYWSERGYEDAISYPDYERRCIISGTKVIKAGDNDGR